MIIQTGTAVIQNIIGEEYIAAVFPLTETDISYQSLVDENTGIKHKKIQDRAGYRVYITADIKLFFPNIVNPITNTTVFSELEKLVEIFKEKKEFYYMANVHPVEEEFKITQEDVNENVAYKVTLTETIDIDHFVKHLPESGQNLILTMKSRNIIKITETIIQEGYGMSRYGRFPYGT